MALSETSPLETALTRIIGEPPVTPVTPPAQLAPKTSVTLGPAATSVALGAPQPVTPEPPAPVYTPPAPVAAPAPAPATPAPVTTAPAPKAPVTPENFWQSQAQYTAANPGGDYTAYRESLPLIYQDLMNYGISPEQVSSGQALTLQRQWGQEVIPTYDEAMRIYGSKRGGPSDLGQGLNIWAPTDQYANPASQYAAGAWDYGATPGGLGYQPLTGREFLAEKGMTGREFKALGRSERQPLRQEFQTAKAARATPAEAMNRVTA
jgi:hypothetical protein